MIVVSLVVVAVHGIALFFDVKPLTFASGLPLAFYVPGGLLVWAASPGPFIQTAGTLERQALCVLLSIAMIAVAGLLLDLTPAGITGGSLTVAIAMLIPAAILLRWGMIKAVRL